MKANKINHIDKDEVLSKAITRLAETWAISNKDVSEIIGKSPTFIGRMNKEETVLHVASKEGQLALLLIRIYRSLGAFLGDRMTVQKDWLVGHNHAFNDTPMKRMKTPDGLVQVVNYLDALRGVQG